MKLSELLAELEEANKRLKDAKFAESQASSRTTQVLNEVNNLQKSIDAEMAKIKGAAEWNTDWHSQRARAMKPAPG